MTNIKGNLKLKIVINEGAIASQVMRQSLYDTYVDGLLDIANEFQQNSPVGASSKLKSEWNVTRPKKEAVTFNIKASITNNSTAAGNRIAGRGPGALPPIGNLSDPESGLLPWVVSKGLATNRAKALGIAFAIRNKIAKEGTERYKRRNNWVGIRSDGSRIPGGRIEQAEKELAARIKARLGK